MFPSASDATLQGFVRVVNHSAESGEVSVMAIDDTGVSYGPLTLSIDAGQTAPFNSDDLETGNADKGLSSGTGAGQGDWRLTLTSDLDIEVLSYIRTTDGFLTSMHDVAPVEEGIHRIAILNPGSNDRQVSRLRLINPGDTEAQVTVEGVDDRGLSPGGAVQVAVAAGAARTLTAAELEFGGTGLTGALGDGAGKWRLMVTTEGSIHTMSLLKSPTGHLTNLSTAPSLEVDGVHAVSMFPSASDATLQGFWDASNEAFRMPGPGGLKGALALLEHALGSMMMHVVRGEHRNPAMAMLGVVPREERAVEGACGGDVVGAARKPGWYFSGLERGVELRQGLHRRQPRRSHGGLQAAVVA